MSGVKCRICGRLDCRDGRLGGQGAPVQVVSVVTGQDAFHGYRVALEVHCGHSDHAGLVEDLVRVTQQVELPGIGEPVAEYHVVEQYLGLSGLFHEAADGAVQRVVLDAELPSVLVPGLY